MSYAQQLNNRISARSSDRARSDEVETPELQDYNNQPSSMIETPPKPQITQTVQRNHYSEHDQSPDIAAMAHDMSDEMGSSANNTNNDTNNNDNQNDSATNIGQDSYIDNGAEESANTSAGGINDTPSNMAVEVHKEDEHGASDMSRLEEIAAHANFTIKPNGKSYKYPALKQYYEFGPWVGRNRKAICIRCKHQSASSQPERLIRHMKRCPLLSDEDKSLADTLMVESQTNKRGKVKIDDDMAYYADMDDPNTSAMTSDGDTSLRLPPINVKRLKKSDAADRKSQIDQALARWIITCRIPLKTIHSPSFVDFVRALDPEYRLPSRETITNVLIPSLLNII